MNVTTAFSKVLSSVFTCALCVSTVKACSIKSYQFCFYCGITGSHCFTCVLSVITYGPRRDKTCLRGF